MWQAMTTAPLDGSRILGMCQRSRHVRKPCVMVVFHYHGHTPEDSMRGCGPCWCAAGVVHYVVEPIKWMPLPEPIAVKAHRDVAAA